jgi:Ca-activated chloride channel family protein
LADKGNGNYSYIDDIKEAKKLFGEELTGTLITVAKDVKIQVEFNPKLVASYRLVGYENRMLNTEDFKDDKKDAGEVGAGHCVTALYEIVPVNKNALAEETPLRYQTKVETAEANKNEIATVKVRYKLPKEDKSTEMQKIIPYQNIRWTDGSESYKNASEDFRFAASVAMWGLVLRSSSFVKDGNAKTVLQWAEMSKGADKGGYRAEYIELVKKNK